MQAFVVSEVDPNAPMASATVVGAAPAAATAQGVPVAQVTPVEMAGGGGKVQPQGP